MRPAHGARPRSPAPSGPCRRIIVGLRAEAAAARIQAAAGDRMQALSQRSGLRFRAARRHRRRPCRSWNSRRPSTAPDLADALARLAGDPEVAFAEPDERVYRHAMAGGPALSEPVVPAGRAARGLNAESAWDVTTGSAGTVVAVLDTGVRFDHPDLLQAGRGGRLLPGLRFRRRRSAMAAFALPTTAMAGTPILPIPVTG